MQDYDGTVAADALTDEEHDAIEREFPALLEHAQQAIRDATGGKNVVLSLMALSGGDLHVVCNSGDRRPLAKALRAMADRLDTEAEVMDAGQGRTN